MLSQQLRHFQCDFLIPDSGGERTDEDAKEIDEKDEDVEDGDAEDEEESQLQLALAMSLSSMEPTGGGADHVERRA